MNKENPELSMIISNEYLSICAKYLDKENSIGSFPYNPFEDNYNKYTKENLTNNDISRVRELLEENNKLKKALNQVSDENNNIRTKLESLEQINKTNSNLVIKLSNQVDENNPKNQEY